MWRASSASRCCGIFWWADPCSHHGQHAARPDDRGGDCRAGRNADPSGRRLSARVAAPALCLAADSGTGPRRAPGDVPGSEKDGRTHGSSGAVSALVSGLLAVVAILLLLVLAWTGISWLLRFSSRRAA